MAYQAPGRQNHSIEVFMPRQLIVALVTIWSSALSAQTTDPAVRALRSEWGMTYSVIRKAAEQVPEADYAFRPVATVRTFGQLLGHIADTQFTLCADALGERNIADGRIEQTVTSKAALLAKLQESSEYCSKAYAQDISTIPDVGGERGRRYDLLTHNTAHNGEHYGNIVTYMRIKGLVPPSSQR